MNEYLSELTLFQTSLAIEYDKKQIDAIAMFKMNKMHLHLTDAAGWRMQIDSYPRLTQFVAWRPQHTWKDWWINGGLYADEGAALIAKAFGEYDKAKTLTFRYQLAVYRRMLQKLGFNLNENSGVYIIPFKFENFKYDPDTDSSTFDSL